MGDENKIMHTYTSVVFALQYILPLFVLIVTYTFIGIRMWNSKVPGADRTSSTRCVIQGRHESVKKVVTFLLGFTLKYISNSNCIGHVH